MGKNLALNIAGKGHPLSVYNRPDDSEAHIVQSFLADNTSLKNLSGYTDLSEFIQSLKPPRQIFLMIKAGPAIDQVIETLLPLISEGDIIIDGGNSHFDDTNRRCKYLAEKGLHFIGCGVSGGEEGALRGPSLMPGGTYDSYAIVAPVLESIAARDGRGKPCCAYIGTEGTGHFIKMVHNGIEYVEMQLLSELYALLSKTMGYEAIADLFATWNKGDLSSYLLEITVDILRKKEGDSYLLDHVLDKAGNKGTGSWSSIAALEIGSANTMMSAAVFARYISSFKDDRQKLAKHAKTNGSTQPIEIHSLEKAYRLARIINHQQGFALMQQASTSYDWNLNLSEIARVWTNGCIIRSGLMTYLVDIFRMYDGIFAHKATLSTVSSCEPDLIKILQIGLSNRIALGAFSAAHNYWIAMTTGTLAANLIQAQRDYFGAHTYQRTDAASDQFFHTNWANS
jgi:6-phosphogluconate dehydrogenase